MLPPQAAPEQEDCPKLPTLMAFFKAPNATDPSSNQLDAVLTISLRLSPVRPAAAVVTLSVAGLAFSLNEFPTAGAGAGAAGFAAGAGAGTGAGAGAAGLSRPIPFLYASAKSISG